VTGNQALLESHLLTGRTKGYFFLEILSFNSPNGTPVDVQGHILFKGRVEKRLEMPVIFSMIAHYSSLAMDLFLLLHNATSNYSRFGLVNIIFGLSINTSH
jgi:hypothetical protein